MEAAAAQPNVSLSNMAAMPVEDRTTLRRGALLGLTVGAVLAVLLLINGFASGSEGMEGSAMIAWIIATPVSLLFAAFGFGDYASQWEVFISLAVPSNGALVGSVIAALRVVARRMF
jgi:hypothetical protein